MFSKEDVLKVAHLARLELTEKEIAFFQTQMGRVLDYVKEINSLRSDDAGFGRHVPQDAEGFREDVAHPFPSPHGLLENAPDSTDGHFHLPAILEGD